MLFTLSHSIKHFLVKASTTIRNNTIRNTPMFLFVFSSSNALCTWQRTAYFMFHQHGNSDVINVQESILGGVQTRQQQIWGVRDSHCHGDESSINPQPPSTTPSTSICFVCIYSAPPVQGCGGMYTAVHHENQTTKKSLQDFFLPLFNAQR